jgi:hypothetical protein
MWSRVLEKPIVAQLVKKFLAFIEHEGPLLCLHELLIGPYVVSDECNPHVHTLFVKDTF